MSTYSLNDVYGVDELEATGSAMVEAHERAHDLGNWDPVGERMRVVSCRLCYQLVWIVRPLANKRGALVVAPLRHTVSGNKTSDGNEVQPRHGLGQPLVVLRQLTEPGCPREGAHCAPLARQQYKALLCALL